eukprot:TRINITY_DN30699_c0_g1_i1.p2 TRINITY_DN30699_c0_g1~~TRINITY_DN30699_c0_g1_i1.p2  ORF type:complete len:77 (-),score=24.18 TRINITY_DN30699_c0_g1_i1:168-398(-)
MELEIKLHIREEHQHLLLDYHSLKCTRLICNNNKFYYNISSNNISNNNNITRLINNKRKKGNNNYYLVSYRIHSRT